MANDQSALCDSARTILDEHAEVLRAHSDCWLTPAQIHTIEGLCASYANLCEAQTLASQRADKLQEKLDIIEGERENFRHLAEYRADELSRTQAAYHALLSGAA